MSKNDKSTLEEAADKLNDAVEEIALKAADAAIEPDPKQVAGTSNEQVYVGEVSELGRTNLDGSRRRLLALNQYGRQPRKRSRRSSVAARLVTTQMRTTKLSLVSHLAHSKTRRSNPVSAGSMRHNLIGWAHSEHAIIPISERKNKG